jgi:hypothetical protein
MADILDVNPISLPQGRVFFHPVTGAEADEELFDFILVPKIFAPELVSSYEAALALLNQGVLMGFRGPKPVPVEDHGVRAGVQFSFGNGPPPGNLPGS